MMFRILTFLASFFLNDLVISLLPVPLNDNDREGLDGGKVAGYGIGCAILLMIVILIILIWVFYEQEWFHNVPATQPDSLNSPVKAS